MAPGQGLTRRQGRYIHYNYDMILHGNNRVRMNGYVGARAMREHNARWRSHRLTRKMGTRDGKARSSLDVSLKREMGSVSFCLISEPRTNWDGPAQIPLTPCRHLPPRIPLKARQGRLCARVVSCLSDSTFGVSARVSHAYPITSAPLEQ
jgi:hypothetical protein